MRITLGNPYPLGATWDGKGVNFALFSEHATRVELCLFDNAEDKKESTRICMTERTNQVWHLYLPDARPGQIYGYRVYGPYDPLSGHRFNPFKVLIDPYAKMIGRDIIWDDAVFGYNTHQEMDRLDSAPYAALGMVVDTAFSWGDDRPPKTPWHKTVLYETHVKGLTFRHPDIAKELRGTYAGLVAEPMLTHLKECGITAVELMPVHHPVNEHHIEKKGLTNYWGYNSLSFFAPNQRYGSGKMDLLSEFKMMVRSLHAAGIEVILDVVYNHTCEGDQLGPTLCLRGIDNKAYYRLQPNDLSKHVDYTGCGNTLNMCHPRVLQLIMDSLRYWITEMHVDGFRFDLASALARELHAVDRLGAFFDIIQQDPIISQVKLIAEPWDLGEGGYQVGNFPALWTEWNGKYRDTIRHFWRPGEDSRQQAPFSEVAERLAGSRDFYDKGGRHPHASINFITCHDGFTLHDLCSYNVKHNEANQEESRDGTDYNVSWNCGVEGETDNPVILSLREKQKRNFMITLLISQGVPMLSGGDEVGRTQKGNNNPYAQDNETTWYDWNLNEHQANFLHFTKRAIRILRLNPVFCRRNFLQDKPIGGLKHKDITWLLPSGEERAKFDNPSQPRAFGICLAGDAINETNVTTSADEWGHPTTGETTLILFNPENNAIDFVLPSVSEETRWILVLDTASPQIPDEIIMGGAVFLLREISVSMFQMDHRGL